MLTNIKIMMTMAVLLLRELQNETKQHNRQPLASCKFSEFSVLFWNLPFPWPQKKWTKIKKGKKCCKNKQRCINFKPLAFSGEFSSWERERERTTTTTTLSPYFQLNLQSAFPTTEKFPHITQMWRFVWQHFGQRTKGRGGEGMRRGETTTVNLQSTSLWVAALWGNRG